MQLHYHIELEIDTDLDYMVISNNKSLSHFASSTTVAIAMNLHSMVNVKS